VGFSHSGVSAKNRRGLLLSTQSIWYFFTFLKKTPNPLISAIDNFEKRRLVVIRTLSLNQTASDPRTKNGTAKVESKARAALERFGVKGMIAQPIN
jgi:hypothetical protein